MDEEERVLVFILGFVIFIFVFFVLHYNLGEDTNKKAEIVAVADGTKLYSAFLSGSNEKLEFFYYKKAGDGYKLDSKKADMVTVFEDSETPYIQMNCKFFIFEMCTIDYELHVPKGSIVRGTSLDLMGRMEEKG